MKRPVDRWLVALVLPSITGCARTERRHDDLGALIGDYERPRKNVHGEVVYAKLFLSKQGITGENLPFTESITYQESICSAPKSCKIRAILCTLSIEERDESSILVNADAGCERMAGVWYTKEQSTKVALELMSGTPALASAAPEPPPAPADFPSSLPSAGPNVQSCMRSCQALQTSCEAACKSSEADTSSSAPSARPAGPSPPSARSCSEVCKDKALSCLLACP